MAAQMEIRNITRSASCRLTESSFLNELFAEVENQSKEAASKKLCLCSPTTHAGSFRCRFHRVVSVKNPGTSSSSKKSFIATRKSSTQDPDSSSSLSRFGGEVVEATKG